MTKRKTKHFEENKKLRPEGKQRCVKCNRIKPMHLYYKRAKAPTGYATLCKACSKKYQKNTQRGFHLRNTYGLTLEEYDKLKKAGDGKCWICGGGSAANLAVDHNHDNLRIRGLLCKPCNRILGRWKDSPDIALRAFDYLVEDGLTVQNTLGREAVTPK